MPFVDLSGRVFARLTVLHLVGASHVHKHYRCRCECGRETTVDGTKLVNGHTRSCGCIRRGVPNLKLRLPEGEALRRRAFSTYRTNASRKGQEWALSYEQFTALTKGDCHYCGVPPSTTLTHPKMWGTLNYNGIDRLTNGTGYVAGNVVSCCMECNFRKGAADEAAFIAWVKRVAAHQDGSSRGTRDALDKAEQAGVPWIVVAAGTDPNILLKELP